jgi:hypothetical protein
MSCGLKYSIVTPWRKCQSLRPQYYYNVILYVDFVISLDYRLWIGDKVHNVCLWRKPLAYINVIIHSHRLSLETGHYLKTRKWQCCIAIKYISTLFTWPLNTSYWVLAIVTPREPGCSVHSLTYDKSMFLSRDRSKIGSCHQSWFPDVGLSSVVEAYMPPFGYALIDMQSDLWICALLLESIIYHGQVPMVHGQG